MPRAILLVAALAAFTHGSGTGATREAPSYTVASIVNSASNQSGAFAPNTFLTIYGTNLAYTTKALQESDIRDNTLPTILPGTGVSVFINHIRAQIFYVSPTQLNILVPADAGTGPAQLQIVLDNLAGPSTALTFTATAPALFQSGVSTAIALHADGSVVTADAPARAGEDIVLYATGLGQTVPRAVYGAIPLTAARIADTPHFSVLLDGAVVDPNRVAYVGATPGFAGLYQINVKLPDSTGPNPEVRLQTLDGISPAGIQIPVQ